MSDAVLRTVLSTEVMTEQSRVPHTASVMVGNRDG